MDGETYRNVVRIYPEVSLPSFKRGFIQYGDFDSQDDVLRKKEKKWR